MTQSYPITMVPPPGYHNWLRDEHVAHSSPMRVSPGWELVGKNSAGASGVAQMEWGHLSLHVGRNQPDNETITGKG